MTRRRLLTRIMLGLAAVVPLVSCQEAGVRPPGIAEAADTADQVLFGLKHNVLQQGIRRSFVEADTAFIYEPTQTAELRNLKVTFYNDEGGISSVLTAREGTYNMQSGAMTARQNVVATASDGRVLRTSILHYDPATQKIRTDAHFTVDKGGDHGEGDGFTSDPDFKNAVISRPRGAEGAPQLLPGQN